MTPWDLKFIFSLRKKTIFVKIILPRERDRPARVDDPGKLFIPHME